MGKHGRNERKEERQLMMKAKGNYSVVNLDGLFRKLQA
jgi:hypothetical protein